MKPGFSAPKPSEFILFDPGKTREERDADNGSFGGQSLAEMKANFAMAKQAWGVKT